MRPPPNLGKFGIAFAAIFAIVFAAPPAWAQAPCALTVAAASDLTYAMGELAAAYEKSSGCIVRVSYGSSGNFLTQIENGAPFDVFFSADSDYPKQLEADGFADAASAYLYASGKLILWVPNESALDPAKGLAILSNSSAGKISIANPEHAPYGRAAVEALRHTGVYDAVKGRLVLGENISQAAQFAASGNAGAGVLALSLALSPELQGRGRYALVPESLYAPIEQTALVLRASKNQQAAQSFLNYVKSPAAAAILVRYGFSRPGTPRRETP